MNTTKYVSAAFGFAFVAAWIAFGFGHAILCLLGAALAYAVVAVLQGEVDLGDLQQRARGDSSPSRGSSPRVR